MKNDAREDMRREKYKKDDGSVMTEEEIRQVKKNDSYA